jgi:hypothetical protein
MRNTPGRKPLLPRANFSDDQSGLDLRYAGISDRNARPPGIVERWSEVDLTPSGWAPPLDREQPGHPQNRWAEVSAELLEHAPLEGVYSWNGNESGWVGL